MVHIVVAALLAQSSPTSAQRIADAVEAWGACVEKEGALRDTNGAAALGIANAALSSCAGKEAEFRNAWRAEYGDDRSRTATLALRESLAAKLKHSIERKRCKTCISR